MMPARQDPLRVLTLARGDEQLVCPEILIAGAAQRNIQGFENCLVEPSSGGKVPHDQLDVIDQSTPMQFLDFHSAALRLRPSRRP